jgi:hypothetical protein
MPLLASFIVDNPIGSSSEKPPFANRDQRLNGPRLIGAPQRSKMLAANRIALDETPIVLGRAP